MKTAGSAALVAVVLLLASGCTIEDHPFGVSIDAGPGQIIVNPVAPTIAEGQSATIAVHLENPPSGDAMVECETANASELTANPEILFFNAANAATPQIVTLAALQDTDAADNQLMVICAAGNFDNGLVNVTIVDDDLQMIIVAPSGTPPIMVGEGASTSVTVRLAAAPATVVAVAVNRVGTKISSSPGVVNFTPANYSSPQAISVMGVQDADTVDDTDTLVLSATGAMQVQVPFSITDDD